MERKDGSLLLHRAVFSLLVVTRRCHQFSEVIYIHELTHFCRIGGTRYRVPSLEEPYVQLSLHTAQASTKAPIGTQQLTKQREQVHAKSCGIASL
ncbi:M35 family metallopeptidase, partial [Photobacterium sp. GB-210]|uniref:M35 family metallopeptidase n=1 Tax=Photobacterium sp. GB-210 TaxID=2022104 RepID=UPI001E633EB1